MRCHYWKLVVFGHILHHRSSPRPVSVLRTELLLVRSLPTLGSRAWTTLAFLLQYVLLLLLPMLLCACAISFCYGEHLPNTGLQPEQCETTSGNSPPRVLSEVLACMYIPVDVLVALLKAIVAKSSFVSVLDMFIGGPCEEEACGRRGSCGVNAGLVCVFSCFCFVVCLYQSGRSPDYGFPPVSFPVIVIC